MDYADSLPPTGGVIQRKVASDPKKSSTGLIVGNALGGFGPRPNGPFPTNRPAVIEEKNGTPFGTGVDAF